MYDKLVVLGWVQRNLLVVEKCCKRMPTLCMRISLARSGRLPLCYAFKHKVMDKVVSVSTILLQGLSLT